MARSRVKAARTRRRDSGVIEEAAATSASISWLDIWEKGDHLDEEEATALAVDAQHGRGAPNSVRFVLNAKASSFLRSSRGTVHRLGAAQTLARRRRRFENKIDLKLSS